VEVLSSSRTERYLREAERRGNIALSLAPDDPDALNAIALTELKFGNEVDASRYLARSLDKFPKHLRSTMALAVIKLSRKDAAGAEEVLRTAVTEAPHESEEHTSELQSRFDLVCRLLLEKKNDSAERIRISMRMHRERC